MMSYEKLDVYQCSIKFRAIATEIIRDLPRGNRDLADQIKRAAMSIPLNIGEGAGKRTKPDCRKYFDNARGSAMECGAAMDVCRVLNLIDEQRVSDAKTLLHRIVAMLTKLAGPG
jgi:four helix bundle protein